MGPLFYILNKIRILRMKRDEEIAGIDISSHMKYMRTFSRKKTAMLDFVEIIHSWKMNNFEQQYCYQH
ncbi:hypothetical protein TorRG33x02_284860 [Trema orientale]|uniref:Uncharacterized protein n=1 Tax=Trema orientale TaxID=63057 RepID=A0A2P5CHE0_TREOI|nr:hypothetical protein TorRG33x02_284860 [Trema orientale]